jgi:hypothetical protein
MPLTTRTAHSAWTPSKAQQKPLTLPQKGFIGKLASAAYKRAKGFGADDDLKADAWRHRESVTAIGCRISEAQRWQFEALVTHFATLAGDMKTAFKYAQRDTEEGRNKREAMAVLFAVIAKLPEAERAGMQSYAQTICNAKFRVRLDLATAAMVQQVVMTMRNRVAEKVKELNASGQ